jgi:hypothetical protein
MSYYFVTSLVEPMVKLRYCEPSTKGKEKQKQSESGCS